MAETIVKEGKMKCRGTIEKGGLAGKECRRTLLVKHPELGWCIRCDRSSDLHPLLSILRDLIKQGELDEKEVLVTFQNQKEKRREEMENSKLRKRTLIKEADLTIYEIDGELLPLTAGDRIEVKQLLSWSPSDGKYYKVLKIKDDYTIYGRAESLQKREMLVTRCVWIVRI